MIEWLVGTNVEGNVSILAHMLNLLLHCQTEQDEEVLKSSDIDHNR